MYEFDPLRPCATALGLKGGRQNLYAVCPGGEGAVCDQAKRVVPGGEKPLVRKDLQVRSPLRSGRRRTGVPRTPCALCAALYTSVAQLEEYRSDTPVVEGSNPSARTIGV